MHAHLNLRTCDSMHWSHRSPWALTAILSIAFAIASPAFAQTNISDTYKVTDAMKAKLVKTGDLTLRDANFVEALFGIRRAWGVNIVVGNELKGETVSCEFVEAPLYEVLDTILGPRGYGYKPVGNSLVVMKQDAFGSLKPLFQTLTIKVAHADANEVKDAVTVYLSEHGQIQAIPSAKRLNVIDFPDRLEMIDEKAKELDDAAKEIKEEDKAAAEEAARLEAARLAAAAAAQTGSGGNGGANGGNFAGMLPAAPAEAAYFDLNFLKAEGVASQLQSLLNPTGRISVFAKDNRVLVVDTVDRLKLVAQAIEQLDVPRPQVRIDALIYDASLEDIRHCGVNWSSVGKGNNLTAAGLAQDSIALHAVTAANPAAAAANGALTFTTLGSNFDLTAVINMLAQSKNSRLLSDPSVIVYDMETASFEAVTEIPFQQLTQGLGGGSIGTTAFREAGTTLTVTPMISRDQTITMNVNPKFSVLAGLTPTSQPIIDRREARTTVRVQNGGTIVIGGLRQRSSIKNMSKIPYFGDLKYIYPLFRDKQATVRESELIVFITPKVIDTGYVGTPRQDVIYNAAIPELNSIPYPKLPDYPCPPDQWPHRCGLCDKCNKFHCGPCNGKNAPDPYGPMTGPVDPSYIEELPQQDAPGSPQAIPEQSPAASPANLKNPAQSPPAVEKSSQRQKKGTPVAAATRVSPFKSSKTAPGLVSGGNEVQGQVEDSLPPLMIPETPIIVPLERVAGEYSAPTRLPVPVETDGTSNNVGQMRRLPVAENDASDGPPQKATPVSGPKRLSPARPVHVAERPVGAGLR